MFTLDETMLRYTWNQDEGVEVHSQDILSLAPRPLVTAEMERSNSNTANSSGQVDVHCLCHHGSWKEVLSELETVVSTPSPLLSLVKAQVEEDGCTCAGLPLRGGFNMPQELFEKDIWRLYTCFLNTFNTREELRTDHVPFIHQLQKEICELVEHCIITMDVHGFLFLQSIKPLLDQLLTVEQSKA